VIIVISFLH